MKCTECRYFQRNVLDSAPWCEVWRKSKRIQPGDEERDLPCKKGRAVQGGYMTNREWIDLLSKEFSVSRTSARDMLHALMTIKRYDNFKRVFDPLPKQYRKDEG